MKPKLIKQFVNYLTPYLFIGRYSRVCDYSKFLPIMEYIIIEEIRLFIPSCNDKNIPYNWFGA